MRTQNCGKLGIQWKSPKLYKKLSEFEGKRVSFLGDICWR